MYEQVVWEVNLLSRFQNGDHAIVIVRCTNTCALLRSPKTMRYRHHDGELAEKGAVNMILHARQGTLYISKMRPSVQISVSPLVTVPYTMKKTSLLNLPLVQFILRGL